MHEIIRMTVMVNLYTALIFSDPMATVSVENMAIYEELSAKETTKISTEDVELIALVTMAEAEGESEEGKRLVIDTILNRIDSEHYPDNAYDVVYQQGQFSSVSNGRMDRCEIADDICELVYEEIENRTNYEVTYFTAGQYGSFGVPLFCVGNHYFSKEVYYE